MPQPGPGCCPACIAAEGCSGALSGVVVKLLNSEGGTVATGTTGGDGKVCLSAAAGAYTAQGTLGEITTSTAVTIGQCDAGATVATLKFVDQVTVTVEGCNGPLSGATVTVPDCGSGQTGEDGKFTCTPTADLFTDGVTISVTWQGRTQTVGPLVGFNACNVSVSFIDVVCVAVTDGCSSSPLPGATVTAAVGGHVVGQGTSGADGTVCFDPVSYGVVAGDELTVTGSYPCYAETNTTVSAACAYQTYSIPTTTPYIGIELFPDAEHCCPNGACPPGVTFPLTLTLNDGFGDITLTAQERFLTSGISLPAGCIWSGTAQRPASIVQYNASDPDGCQSSTDVDVEVLWIWNLSFGFMAVVSTGGEGCDTLRWCGSDPSSGVGNVAGFNAPTWGGTPAKIGSQTVNSCLPLNVTGMLPIPAGSPLCCVYGSDPDLGNGLVCNTITVTLAGESCGNGAAAGDGGIASVFARGSGTDPSAATWSGYSAELFINVDGIGVQLLSTVSGAATTLASLSATGGEGDWYQVQLSAEGSTIAVQVQRYSDGQYLSSAGVWGTTQTNCMTVRSTAVTGSGYLGVSLYSSETQLLQSDNFLIPVGAFSGEITEDWDEVTAPALPSSGWIYNGSLVTDGVPPLSALSSPLVLEAPLGQTGYAAYSTADTSGGNVAVSAWFGVYGSSYSGSGSGGGGSGLPASVSVTFDASAIWGAYAGQTVTLDYDEALGDYPSACLSTATDGGYCDGSGATEGLLSITLTVASPGVVNATAQWTGGVAGTGCADGSCEYYGAASAEGITQGGAAGTLSFGGFTYQSGEAGTFSPGQSYGSPCVQDWDGVTAPALPSDWTSLGGSIGPTTSSSPGVAALSTPNVLLGTSSDVAGAYVLYYSTPDSTDGNVLVRASFAVSSLASGDSAQAWLYARLSNPTGLNDTFGVTPYCYAVEVAFGETASITLRVYTVSLATSPPTTAVFSRGSLTGFALSAGAYYDPYLCCDGESISVWLKRLSDGYWLQSDGSWAATWAPCFAIIDNGTGTDFDYEAPTGSGFVGVGVASGSTTIIQCDNFSLTPITGSASAATISLTVPT